MDLYEKLLSDETFTWPLWLDPKKTPLADIWGIVEQNWDFTSGLGVVTSMTNSVRKLLDDDKDIIPESVLSLSQKSLWFAEQFFAVDNYPAMLRLFSVTFNQIWNWALSSSSSLILTSAKQVNGILSSLFDPLVSTWWKRLPDGTTINITNSSRDSKAVAYYMLYHTPHWKRVLWELQKYLQNQQSLPVA